MDSAGLKKLPIFSFVDEPVLDQLKTIITEIEYEDSGVIFKEGETGDALYIIAEGMIRITKLIDEKTGAMKDLAILTSGEFFGEMSLLSNLPRSASAISGGNTRLLKVSKADFEKLLATDSRVAANLLFAIIQTVSGRLRETSLELITVYDTGKMLGTTQSLEQLGKNILQRVIATVRAEKGIMILKNPAMDTYELQTVEPYDIELAGAIKLEPGAGIIGRVITEQRPYLVADYEDAQYRELAKHGFETRSMLLAPIIHEQLTLGVIGLLHTRPGYFTASHLNLLAAVASQTASAIENSRHREEETAKQKLGRVYYNF